MNIEHKVSPDGQELVIKIQGRFDFAAKPALKEAYGAVDLENAKVLIDLTDTDYMDSSALGMLLLLREKMGGDGAVIELRNCKPSILELFKVSKFEDLFDISGYNSD